MRVGIETAFRMTNETGGINGRTVRLVTADDGYEPGRTSATMKQLYDQEQVFGFIGNVGTPTAAVAAPFALERRALLYGALTGASVPSLTNDSQLAANHRVFGHEE